MEKKSNHRHGPVKKDISGELPKDARQWTPLSAGFMVASIIGFFVSALYISKFSIPMSVAFSVVFFCMFLASMISMRRASPDAQLGARPIR
ncbi:MAG: hypothetical protein QXR48_02680 [Candidatus Woesearchaeota archaeon]